MTVSEGDFTDPTVALRLRDYLRQLITEEIDHYRPAQQYATVLTIQKGGPTFPLGAGSDVEDHPPELPGNPLQLWYANCRLDTGEIIQARIAENIPVTRN